MLRIYGEDADSRDAAVEMVNAITAEQKLANSTWVKSLVLLILARLLLTCLAKTVSSHFSDRSGAR